MIVPRRLLIAIVWFIFVLYLIFKYRKNELVQRHLINPAVDLASTALDVAAAAGASVGGGGDRVNACIIFLMREGDLADLLATLTELEQAFNGRYHYPYVLFNDAEFSDSFKRTVQNHTRATVEFGLIAKEQWSMPEWIDMARINASLLTTLWVAHGHDMNYHHMCRFYSGFFFRHPLTVKYDYYLRLDPHVRFPCAIAGDPFRTLVDSGKLYGFTIALGEEVNTIPSLWEHIKGWMNKSRTSYEQFDRVNTAMLAANCLSNDQCCLDRFNFWDNFELAAFSLWRDPAYLDFFEHLDKSGGFYYERWGDASVHSFYLLIKLELAKIHHFADIAYGHSNRYNWPVSDDVRKKCKPVTDDNKYTTHHSCLNVWTNISHA